MTRKLVFLLAALAAFPVVASEPTPADRILEKALSSDVAYQRLVYLCDRVGHRLTGSAELERAVSWAEATMKADGLADVRTEPVDVDVWKRGPESAEIVAPVHVPLVLIGLGMTLPTPKDGIEAEVVEANSLDEVKALGDQAKGKIVFFNPQMERGGDEERGYGFGSKLRSEGDVAAAEAGAVAMLIHSLGTADYRLPHTGSTSHDEKKKRVPAAALAAEDADRIHRFLAAGEKVRVRLSLSSTLGRGVSHNVIGEIRGSEKPDEVVVIGGHIDSWDVGCGAHDDGAGIVSVMEAMRVIRELGLKPRRTIRAVLFTNEENGLAGGKTYAKDHEADLPKHVAAVEMDSGGFHPQGFGVTAGPGAVEFVQKLIDPLATIDADRASDGGGGADISPMKNFGVPQLGLKVDTTYYFDYHHTQADTVDKVDPHDLAMDSAAMAVMAFGLADAEGTLERVPEEAKKSD